MSGVAQNPIQHLSFPQPQEKCELGQSLRIAICIRALLAGRTGWSLVRLAGWEEERSVPNLSNWFCVRPKNVPPGRSGPHGGPSLPPSDDHQGEMGGWRHLMDGRWRCKVGDNKPRNFDRVPVSHGSAGNLWHFPPSLPPSLSSHRKAGFLPVIVRAKVVGAVFSVCGHPHATRPLSPN